MNRYFQNESDQENFFPPHSDTSSKLGQLQHNLRDARLREAMHRPYYPSPLSQSPLQGSISSASHTAASIASSSHSTVSTSTTPPSTSSRFSINQAFKALTDDDIDFFDRLISTLPSPAADFSQLKAAYTAHLSDELNRRHRRSSSSHSPTQVDWDAHLWSILLSLVKVRGKNWRERWDSVRLAFGLDPNSGDETDLSSATQTTDASITGSSTQHGADSTSERGMHASHERYLRDMGQPASPSHASTPRRQHSHHRAAPSPLSLGLPRSSSPPPRYGQSEQQPPHLRSMQEELAEERTSQTRRLNLDDSISAIQTRLSHMLDTDGELEQGSKSHVTSMDDAAALSDDAVRLPTDAKRRFDDLVRSSQFARSRMRQTQAATHGREEQDARAQQLQMADLWRARQLLQTCLAWWITLTRQQLEKSQNAADASARVLVQKSWERWRQEVQSGLQGKRIGEKTDRVRCTLTAFRRWKRVKTAAMERKDELKKDSMRIAYYTTTATVKKRLAKEAFGVWKHRYMDHLADSVRRRHLQSGAFALWQMRSLHTNQLQARERILKNKQDQSALTWAWERWSDRTEKAKAVYRFQHYHNRLLLVEALHTWRQRTLLSGLSHAFAERRLKLAALDHWKSAVEQQRMRRRQEALAKRWHSRRLKQGALLSWRRHNYRVLGLQDQAVEMQDRIQREKLLSFFHRWQLHSRAALLERVRTTAILERAFNHWKHLHISLTTSLQQRESTILDRRHEVVKAACLHRWRQLAKHVREREEDIVARRNETICNDYFIVWRNKQLQHRLLQDKSAAISDFFVLRSSLQQWRSKLREHRADVKEAHHDQRLVQQVFEIWRSKAGKQRRLTELLQHSLAKSNQTLARAYLNQWVAKIIQVRNRELEIKEQRQRRLLKAAFCAWIEACLRHDDLLALMNSFIDVKEEERKRHTFLHWLNFAREQKERRQKEETLAVAARKKLLATTWDAWRDKHKEFALATQEYEMLMRRHQLSQRWALNTWKSQTLLLPAIRMRNISLKRMALQQWKQRLPAAQLSNQAAKMDRARLLHPSWRTWRDNLKLKRQLRAAARFGAGSISAQRLRTLSAAASAANRSAGSSSPLLAHSSSPFRVLGDAGSSYRLATPLQRPKTSLAVQSPPPADASPEASPRTGRPTQKESSLPRRGTSVPRHLEASFATGSVHCSPGQGNSSTFDQSPSKEAASRRARVVPIAPTSTSISEQSRFSLALKSSTSSISAAYANEFNPTTRNRRQPHAHDKGATLLSAAQRSSTNGQEQSDNESDFARRIKRSAKYDQTPLRSPAAGVAPPESNDGFESANSVHSAPARTGLADRSSTPRQSLAVAEDMILLLRARAQSQQRRQQ
ncbi:hypothetical protein EX895_002003 [Sporisorium graminicola]|uniref:Sfi1 spindle body domain-containing protein n=1 Tax=Sporisorium graminicola TaxID=280036 RepID=A0A4U7L2G4_9BASI|nr:hypothetical protein EX895_002003 [Sporisorium graminicola]TKY89472.1 hypothetical protein EX895_002003 [Sporisorium graminicola]